MIEVTSPTERSYALLTGDHLARLSELAAQDHMKFTRDGGRPEYRDRRVVVTLAQGAALHWLDGRTGVKDFDVWTFYAALDVQRFPADKRETHADFGASVFGRQLYDPAKCRSRAESARWAHWQRYTGRRVDFLMRALPVPPMAGVDEVIIALQSWLERGASRRGAKPSPWYLAQKAVVIIDPAGNRGRLIWPPRH